MIYNGHSAYAEAALADEIRVIGSTPKGRGLRNAAINRGAFKIGGLVGAHALRNLRHAKDCYPLPAQMGTSPITASAHL
jgi:hypothetical protein